jgi:ssDNA-binding Zn-finger/Zn-ribbon topoisomerase 1
MNDKETEGKQIEQAVDPKSLSDRDRFKLESKSPVVNQQELRKKILTQTSGVKPVATAVITKTEKDEDTSSDDEVIVTPIGHKDYVCDKCTKCAEFESKSKKDTKCLNCGCELLFHLVGDFAIKLY